MTSSNSTTDDRLRMIEEMLSSNPNDPFLKYAAALEHRKKGHSEMVIEIFEDLIQNHPDYLGTYYQLGKMYEDQGDVEKALDIYRKGRAIAQAQNDSKTLGELSEALMLLEDDED